MPDYFFAEMVAEKLGLSQQELESFEVRGIIRRAVKNGRAYYSSRDVYRLNGVLHFMRKKGLNLQQARNRIATSAQVVSAF